MTIVASTEVVASLKSHSEMGLLEYQWGISDQISASGKDARAGEWSRLAIERSHAPGNFHTPDQVHTESGMVSLARAIVETAIEAPERYRDTREWLKLVAGLRFDGFELVEEKHAQTESFSFSAARQQSKLRLVRMLPDEMPELDFREAESEIVTLLNKHRFITAHGHLQQAISAFQRGEWSSANGELRNFFESYLNEIAERLGATSSDSKSKRDFLGQGLEPPFLLAEYNEWNANIQKPQYVQGLMSRMHPHGGHPGLSEEEDATFRLQVNLITARLLLRRFDQRVRKS